MMRFPRRRYRARRRPRRDPRSVNANLHVRLLALIGVVALMFATLVGRLGHMQILSSEATQASQEPTARADARTVIAPAVRGRILDRDGVVLVGNTASVDVTVDRGDLVEAGRRGGLLTRVARVIDRPASALWERTFLCGTAAATAPPACWGGSAYGPIVLASGVARKALPCRERPDASRDRGAGDPDPGIIPPRRNSRPRTCSATSRGRARRICRPMSPIRISSAARAWRRNMTRRCGAPRGDASSRSTPAGL